MVRGVNKVILIGNLTRDPTSNFTRSGGAVVNFTLAVSRGWRDRNTNEMRETVEYVRIVVFGPMAENANQYLRQGSSCYVEGRLQTRTYEQNGEQRYITEVVASELTFLSTSQGGNAGPRSTTYGQNPPKGGNRQPSRQPQSYTDDNPYENEVTKKAPPSDPGVDPEDDVPF
ncbi:MAG: single-stranded DNA-binding protein [Gammaproteobacteria bacterium]|nr:single-stranded DNA-binding protein [Gammaproteobacteria bacterium]